MGVRTKVKLAALLLALTVACSDGQATSAPPQAVSAEARPAIPLAGRVTDAADVLSSQQEMTLSAKLEELERATQHQMVVVTVQSLGGEHIAAFTRKLANSWGIGRKGHDDGVVVLIAPQERSARIAVGYGVEKKLPDALCQQIMDQQMIPRFREGDLAGGIEAGVNALAARLTA